MDAPVQASWPSARVPNGHAKLIVLGAVLFLSGGILSLNQLTNPRPISNPQPVGNEPLAMAPADRPLPQTYAPTSSEQASVSDPHPLFFSQPQVVLACRIHASSMEERDKRLNQFFQAIAARVSGLGEMDIRFQPPIMPDGVGLITFRGDQGYRWRVPLHVIEMADEAATRDEVRVVFWLAEPVPFQRKDGASKDEDFHRLWIAVQEQVRLPVEDAAAEIDGLQIINTIAMTKQE